MLNASQGENNARKNGSPRKEGLQYVAGRSSKKIDPKLAAEFMHGGEVHAPSENVSRGTRAAIKGRKFSGVY